MLLRSYAPPARKTILSFAMIPAVVVVAGGEPVNPGVLEEIPDGAYVIAADSGLDHARALGLPVHLVVGDLDSASPEAIADAHHLRVEKYEIDKDATDLELALRAACRLDSGRIIVVGGHGGRLDHLLANAFLLASPEFAHHDLEWVVGAARVHVVRSGARLHGSAGELVSLLPVGGPARGVRTEGLRWPLHGEDLLPGTTRGVSNVFTRPVASVTVESGVLLTVQPEAVA